MKLPLSLIKSFIPIDLPVDKIGETLTLLGIEVDRIEEIEGDFVFEISLTPNLGHCMSAHGLARELSAALQIPIHIPKINLIENGKGHLEKEISIQDPKLCSRYMCRLLEDIQIGPSPLWLQKTLQACGLKPISNAVDAANYILLKWGQPLHAFDFDLLEGKTIEVAESKTPQKFLGLDGEEREIPVGSILIRDAHKTVAIAGILGGANSAVSSKTTRVLLEAAYFDPLHIRTTSKKLSLRTESSQRFEKGIDPVGVDAALNEACHLILEICCGKLAKGLIDKKTASLSPKKIHCRAARANQILGTKLSLSEIENIFRRLGFSLQSAGAEGLLVEVPLYRSDISEEIDLIEEIARIYGYYNIEKGQIHCTTSQIPHDPVYVFEKKVRNSLLGLGLQEFLNCDLISPKLSEMFREMTSPNIALLQAIYSKSEEYSILRTSLLPGLLQSAKNNLDQKNQTIAAFEIGRIHFIQKDAREKVVEIPMASLLLTGKAIPSHWSRKDSEVDFFDLKGLVENLSGGLNLSGVSFHPSKHLSFHPGRQADIQVNDLVIGSLGEVHPTLLEKFDIKQRVLYAEINLQQMLFLQKKQIKAKPLSQFPASERDWTLSLPLSTPIDSVFQAIASFHVPLLEKAELIDLFIPDHSPEKKATFRFIYRDNLKTISLEEIEAAHAALMNGVTQLLK